MWKVLLVTLVVFVGATFSLRAHEWPEHHPWYKDDNCTMNAAKECSPDDHHLHCHDPDYDHIHLCIGESISIPEKCQQMTCIHYDGNVVLLRSCHDIVAAEGCYLTEQDNSKPYPYCCPEEVCE